MGLSCFLSLELIEATVGNSWIWKKLRHLRTHAPRKWRNTIIKIWENVPQTYKEAGWSASSKAAWKPRILWLSERASPKLIQRPQGGHHWNKIQRRLLPCRSSSACRDWDCKWDRERCLEPSGGADSPLEDALKGDRNRRGDFLGNPSHEEPALAAGKLTREGMTALRHWRMEMGTGTSAGRSNQRRTPVVLSPSWVRCWDRVQRLMRVQSRTWGCLRRRSAGLSPL